MVKEHGRRIDHLVVGSNHVPNNKSLRDTLSYGKDNGLLQIAEHPYSTGHFGLGEKKLEKYIADYDALEHNSHLVLPKIAFSLPYLKSFSRETNNKAKRIAKIYKKPFIATSDAHCIHHAGISHITFHKKINTFSEDKTIR